MIPIDWRQIHQELDAQGWAVVKGMLNAADCGLIAKLFASQTGFRSHVHMARHGFGKGEYKYFCYPLPDQIAQLRASLYPPLSEIANRWNAAMGLPEHYPATHAEYLRQCHAAGQPRPTPLLLQYDVGDYNRLHQDLYGELVFPLQLTVLLSQPEIDFTGGEFVLTEQQARMQSRPHVVPLGQGDGVIFAVRHRPIRSARGFTRVNMRHGISEIRSGNRHALGIIFHDAR